MRLDWSEQEPRAKKPTKKQIALYKQWMEYYSNLPEMEAHRRSAERAEAGNKVPKN